MVWCWAQKNHKKDQELNTKITQTAHPYLPTLVIYSIPNRDLGAHSKGGAESDDEYLEFIQEFCNSLGDKSPIVIYEPDCIPHMEQMGVVDGMDRLSLIKFFQLNY